MSAVSTPTTFVESAKRLASRSYSLVAVLIAWELAARAVDNPIFLPNILSVVESLVAMAKSGELAADVGVSTWRALSGFALAALAGVPIGLTMGWFRWLDDFWNSLIALSYPIPKIGLIPLFILWMGIGDTSKIAVIVAGAIFPVIMNTYSGVKGTPKYLVWSAHTLGTSTTELLYKVVLPHTLPYIFTGLRLAMGLAWILLFAAEMVAAESGLGFRILYAQRMLDTPVVFACLIVIAVLGYAFDRILLSLGHRLFDWYYHRNV